MILGNKSARFAKSMSWVLTASKYSWDCQGAGSANRIRFCGNWFADVLTSIYRGVSTTIRVHQTI